MSPETLTGPTPLELSLADFVALFPYLAKGRAAGCLPHFNAAMREFEIADAPLRVAAFVAQVGHESCGLKFFEEISSGAAYEGRKDLGNTEPGDGKRYKGRGPIQLTGRANYRAAGKALGVELEGDPDRAKDDDVAFRIAGWFWRSRHLNYFADTQEFDAITRRINGGQNGRADRIRRYHEARRVLGLPQFGG